MNTVLPCQARRSVPRRALVGTVTAVAVVTAGGIGYAAWTVTATGSSQAEAGTPVTGAVTVQVASSKLFPGGSAPVYFNVTNPNDFQVTYKSLEFTTTNVTVTRNDTATTACAATDVTLTGGSITLTADLVIPAGGNANGSAPGAITLNATAPDACQGDTFQITGTTISGVSG
jgi:hypothetical protein